jgi:DNA-binding transcriptional LysR family regulator
MKEDIVNEQVWRSFKAVSEYRNLSQAARYLNLSQSAVSQHIHRLEMDYNSPLFVRTSQGMLLTEAGEIVYRHVSNLLTVLDESRREVHRLDNSAAKLTVGASLTIAEYILPHALTRLDSPVDRQNIMVRMANSHDVLDQVFHRDIEIGLIEAPIANPQMAIRPFLEDRLQVVVPHTHPWADRPAIQLSEFLKAPLILREPGSGTRMVLEHALHQVGVSIHQLNIRFVLGTTQAIKAMISQGMGISVLSPYTISAEERDCFHLLSVRELALLRHFSLVHHHELAHPTARRLIRILFNLDWPQLLGRTDVV